MKDELRTHGLLRVLTAALAILLTLCPALARAEAATVIPVGRAVGIRLSSDGVVVIGTADVVTADGKVNPARDCGLREGDVITHINGEEMDTIADVTGLLQELEGASMSIRALRDERELRLTAQGVFCPTEGCYKLGALIRDSMAGIGTVTFYCPESGQFGALGHGINDPDTTRLIPMESGEILPASVTGVRRGEAGAPGQLRGAFDGEHVLGSLSANTGVGIFGQLDSTDWVTGEAMETAQRNQVSAGNAVILSNVSGDTVEEYSVRIRKVYPASDSGGGRDFLIEVTDPRLLETTGGIVQGMSGSPIIQDGKLVGAVTHVLVNDPTRGYGIFIENMLDAAG